MNDAFSQALADAASEDPPLIDLAAERLKCLTTIAAGDGTIGFTIAAALNGKSAQEECRMDVTQYLAAVNQALRLVAGTAVGVSYCDFSGFNYP